MAAQLFIGEKSIKGVSVIVRQARKEPPQCLRSTVGRSGHSGGRIKSGGKKVSFQISCLVLNNSVLKFLLMFNIQYNLRATRWPQAKAHSL